MKHHNSMDHRKQHFLQKLYSREIHGSFYRTRPSVHHKAMELYGSIPKHRSFLLKDTFDGKNDHVLVGSSRCGQFVISYTYTLDMSRPSAMQYRYRLHWWAFTGTPPACKVAEVQLFDCHELTHTLHVGIAQWPNVSDRLIVYGYSDGVDEIYVDTSDNHKYFFTVTTLPSLHNCKDCKAVAESFDEEEMAASWDKAVSFSCLKHGLTIHTTLDMAPPYPHFNPKTCLKVDYKIVINTGNFLHVLHFDGDKEIKTSTEPDSIVPDEITHRTGEFLSNKVSDYICPWQKSSSAPNRKNLSKSINSTWLNTIRDKANKLYAYEEPYDVCEPRFKWYKKRRLADKMYEFCSDSDEDMENKCPPVKTARLGQASFVVPETPKFTFYTQRPGPFSINEIYKGVIEEHKMNTNRVPVSSVCDSAKSDKCDFKILNQTSCQGLSGDLMHHDSVEHEFSICDYPRRSSREKDFNDLNTPFPSCEGTSAMKVHHSQRVSSASDQSNHKPHLEVSVINPNLSSILAEWEADSVSSLSPRSDSLGKNDVIQSFLDLMPGVTISPRTAQNGVSSENVSQISNENAPSVSKTSSPKYSPLLVVLRTRNCIQEEQQKPKEQEKAKELAKEEVPTKVTVKPAREPDISLRQRMISECSVRFDRIYIELDDEIISTISTDFEDDDTAFHDALPLSVHGSAYAQLQMVSRQKAERLSMNCERVFQTSLAIDNFCSKAADVICQFEGFKFWHCSDFDVELIDVCTLNCDILGVVCMRVNVEESTNHEKEVFQERLFCGFKCVFIWNPVADQCWLEAYTPLVMSKPEFSLSEMRTDDPNHETPARREANRLRRYLKKTSLFTLRPPVRSFEHRMWVQESLKKRRERRRSSRPLH
ncbi:uncharacterized protein LOC128994721 isoform X2 [Macrosteles quadrilineatus]|uniref:uncharacterized protein LOC128994721 isoform X2 n=1 Tax=Macrosteles quadrilineatus TaxID=74068 RepID=UPI0023E25F97|nr:uncharacterized protein LOC128994721 isoform X2 [Macrosteles quadrilineatus]